MLVGLVLRVHYLYMADFVIDADEAIVGLMGKHILEGGEIPVFYYGQHYMGSFEALCVALSFAIFGVSSFALKAVPLFFSIALFPGVYAIGVKISGKLGARFAVLFFAIPPSALLLWSSMARGGFIELVFVGALTLLLAIKWLGYERPPIKSTLLIGLLLGLGWWINNQIVFFAFPIGLFFFLHLTRRSVRGVLQHGLIGLIGFFVGGLPFWIYNFQHRFISFGMFKRATLNESLEHLWGVFDLSIPILFGAKRFWHEQAVSGIGVPILYLVLAIVFFLLFLRRRNYGVNLLLLFVSAAILIFALSSFGYLVQAPRYLLPIYVGVYLLCGVVLGQLWTDRKRFAASALSLIILLLNLSSSYWGGIAIAGEPFVFDQQRVAHDHSDLIQWLDREGYKFVRTNYWIGYRLAFETHERIKFRLFQAPHQIRIKSYEEASEALDDSSLPFVLVPAQAKRVKNALNGLGYDFRESIVSEYSIIDRIRPKFGKGEKFPNNRLIATSEFRPDDTQLALDSNLETRWGTGAPQRDGMSFTISISGTNNSSQVLAGFEYSLGGWYHDYPRGLRIERELSEGSIERLCEVSNYDDLRYLLDGESRFSCYFTPKPSRRLILTQTGSDPIFDWSIAEISLID